MSELNRPPRPSTAPGCQIILILIIVGMVILFMWLLNNARVNRPDRVPTEQVATTTDTPVTDDFCTNCDKGELLGHLDTLPMSKLEARERVASRILEDDPENTKVRTALIHTYLANNQTEKAETEYLTILDYQPKNIYARQQLVKLYCKTEQVDKAQALYDDSQNVMGSAGFMDNSASCIVDRVEDRTIDGKEEKVDSEVR